MIRIYSHRNEHAHWASIHELTQNKLFPATKKPLVEWSTDHFINAIKKLPNSNSYFEFAEWKEHIPMTEQGYYLIHYGDSRKISDNYGFAVLPPAIRDQIESGCLNLLVVFVYETFDSELSINQWQSRFCTLLNELGITRKSSVKVLIGASSKNMHRHQDSRVAWIFYPWFELETQLESTAQSLESFCYNYNPDPEYKFLSLNRAPRRHRIMMLACLEYLQVTHHGFISWPSDHNQMIIDDYNYFYNSGIKQNPSLENYILTTKKLTGDYHNSAVDMSWFSSGPLYKLANFEIINETHHHNIGDLIFLTEKTFRSLCIGIPFLMHGNPGSLALLHELGYKTFPSVFDESYDSIYSPLRATEFIAGQVHKVCTRDQYLPDPLASEEVRAAVVHNQQKFKSKNHAAELYKTINFVD
jgi:hypothetical protein